MRLGSLRSRARVLVRLTGRAALILVLWVLSAAKPALAADETARHDALGEARDFVGDWEYRWGDSPRDESGALRWAEPRSQSSSATREESGWKRLGRVALPSPRERHGNRFLWLRTPLAGPDCDDPTFYIGPLNQIFEAYLDGQLVYRFGKLDGNTPDARRFLGYPMHLIPLGKGYNGRTLTLRIYSPHISIGFASYPRIGSKARLIRDTVVRDLLKIFFGSVLCAIGLFVFGLYVTERTERAYLYYAVFAFASGLWLLCQLRSRHLFLDVPLAWTYVEYFSLYIFMAALGLFLQRVMGKGLLGIMHIVARIQVVYAIAVMILVAMQVISISMTLAIFEVSILPVLGYYCISIGIMLTQGRGEARLFALGFVGAVLLAAYEIAASIGLIPRATISLSPLGQGCFVITMGLILVQRFRKVHSDLLLTKQELSDKLQSLQVRSAEIENLNVELRHQIQARSSLLITSLIGDSEAPDAAILPEGALLNDRYRIVRILGQGAMGTVYHVERVHDGRPFAAKLLSGRPHRTELARFAREAQLLARLQHENLVAIADIDVTSNRQAYIVMELVEGSTLADQSAQFGDLQFVLPILRQLASALSVIHAAGIVHRDLKPANILISYPKSGQDFVIKVADFGISTLLPDGASSSPAQPALASLPMIPPMDNSGFAETLDGGNQSAPPPSSSMHPATSDDVKKSVSDTTTGKLQSESTGQSGRSSANSGLLTQTGVIMGTPLYMAPELRRGAKLARPASDIFSFGVIAFELLTGRLPSETPPILLQLKPGARWYTALTVGCPSLPGPLGAIIEQCLDPDPERRPTATELVAVL